MQNFLFFSDENLSPLGKDHDQALHIIVETRVMVVPNVLIDNGATINVCLLKTFNALRTNETSLEESLVTVRAYDNTKRTVLGTIELELELLIGPVEFSVTFQVVNIPSSFNLLLGRAWIHQVGALLFSLHQKIKIPIGDEVIIVSEDFEKVILPKNTLVLGIGSHDIQLIGFSCESRVHALMTQNISYLPPNTVHYLNELVVAMMHFIGYFPGQGLEDSKVGISEPIDPYMQGRNHTGLGLKGKDDGFFVITSPDSSLNRLFVKESEDFPYCGFQEPWVNMDG